MWLRRTVFAWLLPAAFLLPLWLLAGWGIFHAGGWAFLWVLLIAIPSVFLGQLLFAMLVRARPSVRAERAVSGWDVAGFGLWHGLTIALGFYPEGWFGILLAGAIVVGLAMLPLLLWQLWSEARGSLAAVTTAWETSPHIDERTPDAGGVFIVQESPPQQR